MVMQTHCQCKTLRAPGVDRRYGPSRLLRRRLRSPPRTRATTMTNPMTNLIMSFGRGALRSALHSSEWSGRTWRRLKSLRLLLDFVQLRAEACPRGGARAPDIYGRLDRRGIVQRPNTNDRQPRATGVFCEQVASASRAETTSNLIAALRSAGVLAEVPGYLNTCRGKNRIDRAVSCKVLAVAAPADPRGHRLAGHNVADVSAEATSGANLHEQPPVRMELTRNPHRPA